MFRCPSKVVFLIGLLTLHHCLARPAEDVENKQKAPVENVKEGATDGKEQPSAFAKMQSPPQFPGLPPELENVLPADVVQKLKAIHVDPSMPFLDKQEKIDKIMTALPTEILDKIPPPPGFNRLPEEVRNKLKQIHRNKDKSWAQKQQELQAYVQSLPNEQRAMMMMGPPPPPPPMGQSPNFGRRR